MAAHHEFHKSHGAELLGNGTARFRLWAPSVTGVTLEIGNHDPIAMRPEPGGWFTAEAPCTPGTHYHYRLPDGTAVPDPASRLQSGDVHGDSVVTDPRAYIWQHPAWNGRPWNEAVLYELHPGTFGGFTGIMRRLPYLKELGVTAVELMPIADFPGRHNWGYDGVLPYAPDTAYGTPEDLKLLIDTAHGMGLMVVLDVVYNHFGPDGAYTHLYASPFFDQRRHTPWGAAIDFTVPELRDFFIQNALYWLEEFRFDGLRLDAVHAIAPQDFLGDMVRQIRAAIEPGRDIHLILEHGGNRASLLAQGFDAQWSDDFHHSLHVLLTGENEGYYTDFQDAARLLARCLAEGFAFQGETSAHYGTARGEPSASLPPTAFVTYLQNHDQTGNRAFGERLTTLADPRSLRAAIALHLLIPQIPLIFMGEEWGSEKPFLFFTDHKPDLAASVRDGRRGEFRHFAAFADPARREEIPDPNDPATFRHSIPDFDAAARPPHSDALAFYRALLTARRAHVLPRMAGCESRGARVLGPKSVCAEWRMADGTTLVIATNLDRQAVATAGLSGPLLFETIEGAAEAARGGTLPAATTVAFLRDASP